MERETEVGVVLADRYQLLRPLRLNPAGPVWEAIDLARGGSVDVCLVRGRPFEDTACRTRLLRAIESLRWPHFAHPGAPWLLGHGEQGDLLFVVMEAVRGESVKERLERRGVFDWREAAGTVVTVISALDAAARLG